jgi:uridine phosphorylase
LAAVTLRHEIRPHHVKPATELAERVLLPGDPHRALAVAQHLLEAPKMFNHHRGLWGYTGVAPDGEPLTVQSTGMGGPSAAIVVEELIALGARRLVRIGTCGALAGDLELGALLAVAEVLPRDGTSAALGAGERLHADL